jgi:INO80 complex subunit C
LHRKRQLSTEIIKSKWCGKVVKFSDLSGLPAPYTDPQTRLRFANKEEYATLIGLPMDITAGYLALRGASSIVG